MFSRGKAGVGCGWRTIYTGGEAVVRAGGSCRLSASNRRSQSCRVVLLSFDWGRYGRHDGRFYETDGLPDNNIEVSSKRNRRWPVVVVVVCIVDCLLLFDDNPPILIKREVGTWEQDIRRSSGKRRTTLNIHPRKETFDSPDFLQSWVQLVVTLIFHTSPPHPESACPGRCRVAIVVVVSPSVSSSSPSSSSFRPDQNKQTNNERSARVC